MITITRSSDLISLGYERSVNRDGTSAKATLARTTTNVYDSGAARGGRGEASPLWVDVQKLCNMCVLSLSWNFFVTHDKYIARPSSKEPR